MRLAIGRRRCCWPRGSARSCGDRDAKYLRRKGLRKSSARTLEAQGRKRFSFLDYKGSQLAKEGNGDRFGGVGHFRWRRANTASNRKIRGRYALPAANGGTPAGRTVTT